MTSNKLKKRILMKGYMRPDKTSYYVVIPKPVRELLDLKGGEYFLMKVDVKDREIELKLVDFEEDTTIIEDSSLPTTRASAMTEMVKESSQSETEERLKGQ